jgi:undecaprenyl-diphosphatase
VSLWEAIVLGIVQGATEFLPVSSSGHLVLSQELMGLAIPGVLFEVAVHLATLVSILVVYRERVMRLVSGSLRGDREAWSYVGLLVVATIPAAVIGLLFKERIEAIFDDPVVTGVAFLVTGALLWSTRSALRRNPTGHPMLWTAVLMGFAQAFALIPGVSRSGTTVVAALWAGVAGREAAAFSFLMAVPAIAGAAVLQIPDVSAASLSPATLIGGGVAAAVTGVLAIRSFVVLLQRQSFHRFALYLWPLGVAFLVYLTLLRP